MEFHIVQNGDTLQSISERYRITVSVLKSLNNLISEPAVGIKLIVSEPELSLTNEVYYCTRVGKVKGLLTTTEHVILFDPFKVGNTCEIIGNAGKETGDAAMFQTFIDLSDVIHCNIVELQGSGSRGSDQVFFIEFMLSRTGREKRGVRSDIPKINVYFKLANILQSGETLQFLHLKTKTDQILALVSSSLIQIDRNRADSGTFIPFYEVNKGYIGKLNSGFDEGDDDEEFKEFVAEIMNEEKQQQEHHVLPQMSTNSKFLTPKMITQILANIPNVFQHRSWELLYSTYLHGRSISSFYNQTDRSGPNILVVKDSLKYVFGAYLSMSWRKSYSFYGTGECFVFTFRNNESMKIFYSSLANTCFMNSDHEAIMIGSGGNAAIYIDKNLEAGNSGRSQTFLNQVLSGEEHFQILDVEIWGLV